MSDSGNESGANPAGSDGITVNVFGRTDVGLVREHNEDNFLVADLSAGNRSIKPEVRTHEVGPKGSLFVVCDGMGGAAAGEVASQIGVDTIYDMMQEADPAEDDEGLARQLDAAITEAGVRIFTAAKVNRKQRGMGTTVTAAALRGPRLIIGQVGDSRAYILRGKELTQVTKDQSLVQQLIDAKQLTEEEARYFDRSNIILQALGTTEEVHVDMTSTVLRRGDTLIMCSDGLSGPVEAEAIREVVLQLEDPLEMCKRLTDLACEGGGHDNITVIVARFDGEGLLEPREDEDIVYKKFHYTPLTQDTVRRSMPKNDDEPSVVEEIGRNLGPDAGDGRVTQRRKSNFPLLLLGALAGLVAGGAVVAYNVFNEEKHTVVAPPGRSLEAASFQTGSDPAQVAREIVQPDVDTGDADEGEDSGEAASGTEGALAETSSKEPGSDGGDVEGLPGGDDAPLVKVEEAPVNSQEPEILKESNRDEPSPEEIGETAHDMRSTHEFDSTDDADISKKSDQERDPQGRPQAKEKEKKAKALPKRGSKEGLRKREEDSTWRPPEEEIPKKLDNNPF